MTIIFTFWEIYCSSRYLHN